MRQRSALLFSGLVVAILAAAPVHATKTERPKAEPKVYVAPSGTVYHLLGCIALKHLNA